ncbi:peptidase [Klebsiella quasipneumoniae]|uniref:peptidase n=1 Tax=Klebsiella quasipneumoniae TaxID=1463165 RepID=UPI001C2BB649|nr:peptidase [Klebsiella quasipneumoniae]MBV0363912.1 peptidase [Klebsiella quasipneumoniae]MDT9764860.1 peptidase [Klebsiella quasipneumoniae]MDW3817354.1 peptidase [Klebsiella quasipneumoniae]MDZ3082697.1 peptidase [Klebsiella quasipneumoniae]HCT9373648.1 peptidase [Klebsiella quasipneumoniae]
MNLLERLLHRRLCNEQPADGGAAPAASEPSAPSAGTAHQGDQPAQPDGGNPSVDGEGQQEKTDSQDGDQQKPEKEQKQEGAPEKYEFQAGEGVELDAEALKDFEPVARELNLTNEQAQKLVDAYPKILAGVQQRQADAWQAQTEEWAATVKADKEIGGDKLTANLGVAQRALDTFGTPALKEYLNGTGLGNHPELVKAFVKVGKAMSEDGVVTGKESGQRSAAEVLYGK